MQSGIRFYTEEDVEILGLIRRLKDTGMPLYEIARFVRLTKEGDKTLRERCDILRRHRSTVWEQRKETETRLDRVTRVLEAYSEKLDAYEKAQDQDPAEKTPAD